MNLQRAGQVGLKGPKGMVGEKVAGAVANRTRFTEEQVAAVIGGLLLAWSLFRTMKLAAEVVRASRED
jgi:hypothetical protein